MTQVGQNWACPYCSLLQVVSEERYYWRQDRLYVSECEAGVVGSFERAIVCANSECRKLSYSCGVVTLKQAAGTYTRDKLITSSTLLPPSFAKPQPGYIPEPIRADYLEACAIRDLSPKASATLSRRCIQGIIRDFCGISKSRLKDEIDELSNRVHAGSALVGVHPDTVEAIDKVRELGNIGAHMEKDISVIVDVDPGEAQTLIEMIEMLFDEWYVARQTRAIKLGRLAAIAAQKQIDKQPPPWPPSTGKPT